MNSPTEQRLGAAFRDLVAEQPFTPDVSAIEHRVRQARRRDRNWPADRSGKAPIPRPIRRPRILDHLRRLRRRQSPLSEWLNPQ